MRGGVETWWECAEMELESEALQPGTDIFYCGVSGKSLKFTVAQFLDRQKSGVQDRTVSVGL